MKVQAFARSWEQQPGRLPEPQPHTMDLLETDARYRRNITADIRRGKLRHKAGAKSCLLMLLTFVASCGLYFALWLPEPSWVSAGVKTLPVLGLVVFLTAQAWGDGAWTPAARRVCWGLMFSSVGDACLVWPHLFLLGMAAFALAHVSYLWALGLRPVRPRLLLLLALAWAGVYASLWPCLRGPYVPAVGVYGALLAAVGWRALARPPPRLTMVAGSLLFMASDLVLARDRFCAPVPQARLVVMGTYYVAQGLIAAWAPRAGPRWKEN